AAPKDLLASELLRAMSRAPDWSCSKTKTRAEMSGTVEDCTTVKPWMAEDARRTAARRQRWWALLAALETPIMRKGINATAAKEEPHTTRQRIHSDDEHYQSSPTPTERCPPHYIEARNGNYQQQRDQPR
ncbi:hypothetical protein FOZ63_030319, partial [Perkinsus olseni]